jgi:hypothetical protein
VYVIFSGTLDNRGKICREEEKADGWIVNVNKAATVPRISRAIT